MKKIKRINIDPDKLVTKAQHAKDIRSNPVQVQRMIDKGELTIVKARGGELIHL